MVIIQFDEGASFYPVMKVLCRKNTPAAGSVHLNDNTVRCYLQYLKGLGTAKVGSKTALNFKLHIFIQVQ